ncbi:sperm acrosome-associated protein 5-like isoform X3 [Ornithorhynchus anatinus]|uniref:sperm acrosome-associated protein 5-like isoform X3 n=1 Tax=Ornithorhynchus anatinus TaxID=9258 RepID=UPI0019D4D243|nr:sperm acrosome-associated protein 5-like isoform X3 [Ornithorhynchus anatinus]
MWGRNTPKLNLWLGCGWAKAESKTQPAAHRLCLAHHGSGLNTEAIFRLPDGSMGYGVFQIRGHKWCSPGEGLSENHCHMDCQDLLDTDLSNDITCAKIMVDNPGGTDAWDPWSHHCKGHDLSDWAVNCGH